MRDKENIDRMSDQGKKTLLRALDHKGETGEIPSDLNMVDLNILSIVCGYGRFQELYKDYKKSAAVVVRDG